MSIILNIDTSLEIANVGIAKDGNVEASRINKIQKEHAAFLHHAIKDMFHELSLDIKKIDAIAVANGPGSYTGLRVGLASAKGLCYALKKPLITIGSLNVLAAAAINASIGNKEIDLFCPMVDARRMEIYTAIFDNTMNEIMKACAMVLNKNYFDEILKNNRVLFFGSGSLKWKTIAESGNASFLNETGTIPAICQLSFQKFQQADFADLTYSEPLYIKEFFTP